MCIQKIVVRIPPLRLNKVAIMEATFNMNENNNNNTNWHIVRHGK